MTISDLIAKLTLLDPDKGWLLPIEIARIPADGLSREVDFVAITADAACDEIEGHDPDSIQAAEHSGGHL